MQNNLKAFVKYAENNEIVSGMLLKRRTKPAGAGWVEIPANETDVVSGGGVVEEQAFISAQALTLADFRAVIMVMYVDTDGVLKRRRDASIPGYVEITTASSDPGVVLVINQTYIIANSVGTATLTTSSVSGKTYTFEITVTE